MVILFRVLLYIYDSGKLDNMRIRKREKEKVSILDLEGNIDINSSDLIEAVGWLLNHRKSNIICNMAGVNLVDYIGISILAIIYKNVLNHKGKIKFYNIPPHINKLFNIVGLDKVLERFDTEDQALNSFGEDDIIAGIMEKKLRRSFERAVFNSKIEYKQKFSHNAGIYKGKIINISAAGAFIIGEKTFPIGEMISTKLYLMPNPGVVKLEAKVIWKSSSDVHPLEYPAMGIEFYNIDSQAQKAIIEFTERHIAGKDLE